MPDLLIRGMRKPTSCDNCPMYTCMHNFDDCPIHELPEHGDLIDKSELLENSKVNGMYPHWIDTMDVKRAPVIVQADKEESE